MDIVFPSHSLNSTQELQLTCILLSEFFTRDDPTRLALFFHVFGHEVSKSSRKFVLLKFIITAIAIGNGPALNAAATYLLDPQIKEVRISSDLNRLLINEITYFSNNSLEKLKALPTLSPLFTTSLFLIFAETFKDDQLPTKIIAELVTLSPSPFIFCFSIPTHIETGAFILGSFLRYDVISELYDEPYSYSQLHLKILNEMMGNVELTAKPIVYTKYLEAIVEQIQRACVKIKDPERIQRSIEKFAQLIQVLTCMHLMICFGTHQLLYF